MNLLYLFVCVVAVLFLAVGGVGVWVVANARRREQRYRLIQLASAAAADETAVALIALLDALDHEPATCPVTVKWLPHNSARNPVPAVLLTISWDGNEWRRVTPVETLREQVEAAFHTSHGALATKLRRDLAGLPAT